MDFYRSMCRKYGVRLYRSDTDEIPGKIIYEDDFQIAIINTREDLKVETKEI